MAIVRPPIQENDGYSLQNYTAPQSQVLGAVWDDTVAKNPTAALSNLMEQAIGDAQAERGPQAYVLSPEDANAQYGELGLKFDKPVSASYASTLAQKKRDEIKAATIIGRGPKGFIAGAERLAVGLAASAADPINIGASFIPIIGEERFATMAARIGTRPARLVKGAAEGAVGAAVVEPLSYYGAQAAHYDYDGADSLMNIAFGTVLGGGLHFAGGEIKDAWHSRKMSALAKTGSAPPPVNLSQRVDNLTSTQRADVLRTAVGQLVTGRQVDVEKMLDTYSRTALQSKTAISRFTPGEPLSTKEHAEIMARAQNPETFKSAEQAQELHDQLSARAAALQERVGKLTPEETSGADAVKAIDEALAATDDPRKIKNLNGKREKILKGFSEEKRQQLELSNELGKVQARLAEVKPQRRATANESRTATVKAERDIIRNQQMLTPEPAQVMAYDVDVSPKENTILRAAEKPEDIETALAELDDMLTVEWKNGTLTEAEMNAIDAADKAVKDAESAARGLFAAATCIFRKV